MAVTRTRHYAVDPADFEELLARRATVIAAIRAALPGLAQAQLTRQENGTYTDIWRWDTAEQMQAALAAMPIPRGPRGHVTDAGRRRRRRRNYRRTVTTRHPRPVSPGLTPCRARLTGGYE